MDGLSVLRDAAVLRGAAVAAIIALAGGIAGAALPERSALTAAALVVILAGMGLGGYLAGRAQPDVALTAGGVAALVAAAALQVLSVVVALIRGRALGFGTVLTIVFVQLLCTSCGVVGGYVAFRRSVGSQAT